MDLPDRCVVDANIWIDLDAGGLLTTVFLLPITWFSPDVVLEELKRNPSGQALLELGVVSYALPKGKFFDVAKLRSVYRAPTIQDLFALTSAKTLGAPLLTGDARLRKAAEENDVAVKGTLWILDVLASEMLLSPSQAKETLESMLKKGRRLPKVECQSRLLLWESTLVKEALAAWG